MRVLVTGGGGFLGRWIVKKLLERGDKVRTLVRHDYPELQRLGAELLRADLCDREATISACQGMDMVLHVASRIGHWGKWKDFYETNVEGTHNIIDGCRKHDVTRLVYTSTPAVVFDGKDLCNIDETCPYPRKYHSNYAASKAIAEQMVISCKDFGLNTVVLRPHLVWGPGDTNLIPGILRQAMGGHLVMIGDRKVIVDFTYVENVADAHVLAADRLNANQVEGGQIYFITQGEPVDLWEFVNTLLERLTIPKVKKNVPPLVARVYAAISETIFRTLPLNGEPKLTRFLLGQLSHSHYFNNSKAERELGYRPRVSMEEGLNKTVEYFEKMNLSNKI